MKKTSLLLCIALLFSCLAFTSCAKIETAEQLMKKIDSTMNKLDFYEVKMDMDMTFYLQKKEFKSTAEGRILLSNEKSKDFIYYYETKVKTSSKYPDVSTEVENILAFQDGNMFMANKTDDVDQKVRSAISQKDFITFLEEQNDSQFDVLDCENKEILQNEDKSWKLTCSGYSSENAIKLLGESFDSETLGVPIKDMELTMNVDKKFRMDDMSIRFVFETENQKNVPAIQVTFECVNYDDSELEDDLIDKTKYTEVPDVRDYYKIEKLLEDANNKAEGSFILELEQNASIGTSKNRAYERDTVSYGTKDEKFYYSILARANDTEYEIKYENGVQTLQNIKNAEMTDLEAKALIRSLINSAGFDKTMVSNIEKTDNGYVVTINDPDISEFGLSNYKIVSQTQTLTITYTLTEDGELKSITSKLEVKGELQWQYGTRSDMEITKTTTVIFFEK